MDKFHQNSESNDPSQFCLVQISDKSKGKILVWPFPLPLTHYACCPLDVRLRYRAWCNTVRSCTNRFCMNIDNIFWFIELQFPNDANVYYAMDQTSTQTAFLVRKISQKTPKKLLKNKSFTGSAASSWLSNYLCSTFKLYYTFTLFLGKFPTFCCFWNKSSTSLPL